MTAVSTGKDARRQGHQPTAPPCDRRPDARPQAHRHRRRLARMWVPLRCRSTDSTIAVTLAVCRRHVSARSCPIGDLVERMPSAQQDNSPRRRLSPPGRSFGLVRGGRPSRVLMRTFTTLPLRSIWERQDHGGVSTTANLPFFDRAAVCHTERPTTAPPERAPHRATFRRRGRPTRWLRDALGQPLPTGDNRATRQAAPTPRTPTTTPRSRQPPATRATPVARPPFYPQSERPMSPEGARWVLFR